MDLLLSVIAVTTMIGVIMLFIILHTYLNSKNAIESKKAIDLLIKWRQQDCSTIYELLQEVRELKEAHELLKSPKKKTATKRKPHRRD